MKRWFFALSALLFGFFSSPLIADMDDAPLDPGPVIVHPIIEYAPRIGPLVWDELPTISDIKAVFEKQTRVKTQGKRGTCSIFSTIGIVESLYKMRGETLDLNENYLQFIVTNRIRGQAAEGSDVNYN